MPYSDPEQQRRYHRERAARRRKAFMEGMSCVDCGTSEQLELDHRDPADKEDHRIWQWSATRIVAEMAKCDPRCRDCHSARHAAERRQEHGVGAYKRGCRCLECRAANAEKNRRWRHNRATALKDAA